MARLRREIPTAQETTQTRDLFAPVSTLDRSLFARTAPIAPRRTSPRKEAKDLTYRDETNSDDHDCDSHPIKPLSFVPKLAGTTHLGRKQIRLAPLKSAILQTKDLPPRRAIIQRESPADGGIRTGGISDDDTDDDDEFCCSDPSSDDSEEDLPSLKQLIARHQRKDPSRQNSAQAAGDPVDQATRALQQFELDDLSFADNKHNPREVDDRSRNMSRPGTSTSDELSDDAVLRFSPPTHAVRKNRQSPDRPCTPPPQPPSKSRLASPSKTAKRIPSPSVHQSLDSFWNLERVNDWNEQYSPQKTVRSPKKIQVQQLDLLDSPSASPRKVQSPTKLTRAEIGARKEFHARKHRLAEDFLAELDQTVTEGRIQKLAASTGGVSLVWSKTLNTTAGRANWRHETIKTRKADGTTTSEHKHFATIELAEKVIDDETRLLNVMAHEFCHLANFMISGIKDRPHGAEFKAWGVKCTAAFADRAVEVTTKHSYQIEFKYIWACSNEYCGQEYKRHSKSIDPNRHTCGKCRDKLVQLKPVPRKGAVGGQPNAFAAFVKQNFPSIRRSLPAASHKEIMEIVGQRFRAERLVLNQAPKAECKTTAATDQDDVAKRMELMMLKD